MRSKLLIKCLVLGGIAIMLILASNMPIFTVSKQSDVIEKGHLGSSSLNRICVVQYTYTTGAGWRVVDTNVDELIGQNVYLYTLFDPRLLKDNVEFDLDYLAKYKIEIDTVDKIAMKDQKVYVINPKSITILYDTDKKKYRLKDMSYGGIIKSFLSIVNKRFRYSY